MPSQPIDTGWGFNAVIDLIESDYDAASPTLSAATPVKIDVGTPGFKSASGPIAQPPLDTHIPRLGDFTKLFDELGISRPERLAPASPLDSEGPISSDDAFLNGQADAASIGDPDSPLAGTTVKEQKKERKKAAKKERKEARRALKASLAPEEFTSSKQSTNQPRTRSNVGAKIRPATPLPVEAQSQAVKPQPSTRVPNFSNFLRNSADPASVGVPQRLNSLAQPFTPSPGPFMHQDAPIDGFSKSSVTQVLSRPSLHEAKPGNGLQPQVPPSVRLNHGLVPRTLQPASAPRIHVNSAQASGTPTPQPVVSSRFEPSATVQNSGARTDAESASRLTDRGPYQLQSPNRFATPTQLPVTPRGGATGLTIKPRIERHFQFLNQLLANFPEDSQHLLAPMPLNTEETAARGIHCFVDASNIMIGFKNILRERGQYQPLEMSFDTLALLMERRRPVAKRIYASSQREANPLPHVTKLAATSKAVGYENLIQEQVYIRREDSDRKKFFKDVERLGWTKATQLRSGSGSDSETGPAAAATLSAPKWVEQGVDEILHLKMCQSVLDTEVPTTMVLATGDGNAAEHSDGFLANVERALKKGWVVELVSWKQQMSAGYKNRKFRAKWGERFKVIQLDDYLESLVETQ
ncbi:uncharacterized protein N0V89_010521 [Didymosphaeria variabile]|uniref:NYN domain-containing protein n=1 Tax=Didymosphaeria variabile TaxID=1932322 RepID=A0A9W8XBH0_9PLEO|nr:uncharacterized protein N0V89_010521 [Didymosphaeria variabile]KAJ4346590.1 hypothetical protein N0V89_010521 [Didymosphaeria variabile]